MAMAGGCGGRPAQIFREPVVPTVEANFLEDAAHRKQSNGESYGTAPALQGNIGSLFKMVLP